MTPKVLTAKSIAASVLFFLLTVLILGVSARALPGLPAAAKAALAPVAPAAPARPAASAPASPAKPAQPPLKGVVAPKPTDYYTVTPCRVYDTRLGSGAFVSGETRTVPIAGSCGVPSTAKVVVLNVAVADFSAQGRVAIYPGTTPPALNAGAFSFSYFSADASPPQRAKSDFVQATILASDGSVTADVFLQSGTVNLILDVYGYYDIAGPVMAAGGGSPAFTEDAGPVTVDPAVSVSDVASATLSSATVTITNLLDAGAETLAATTAGTSITASYAAPTLTLSGVDTLAHYQQVLQSVTYDNSSQNPDTTSRIISFASNDGITASNTVSTTVGITAVNDAPVVTTTAGTTSFTEAGGPVTVDSGITVTDVDNTNLASATVTITNLLDAGAETLAANTAGTSITAVYAAPTLTLTGSDTLANYQQVLQSITYDNSSQNPTTTTRSISFVVNDGTANSNTATKSVSLTAVDNAPVVTTTGGAASFTEAGGAVTVDSGVTVTDSDSTNLASATVTITNLLDAGSEVLAASTAGTSITAVYAAPTLTLTGSDTVAHYQQVFRSVTYNNTSQNPATTARVIAFVANDGTSNSNTATRTVTITAVNNAPVVTTTGGSTAFTEAGGAVVVDAGVTVTDVDNTNLASAAVTITNLLDSGSEVLAATTAGTSITAVYAAPTLTLSGSDTVAHYQQVLRSVTYDNTSQNPATTARSISFVANDGTVNSNTATKTVTIAAVNNAPVVTTTGGATAFTEAGGAVVVDAGVTVTDVDNTNLASATVTISNLLDAGSEVLAASTAGTSITAVYAAPTLTLTGSDTLAHYQQVFRSVTYNNTSQNPSTTARTISFVANDGTANSNTATKSVTITAVNQAPVVTTTGGTASFTEGGGAVVVDAGVTVTDVDNANLASAAVTITNLLDTGAEILAANTAGTSITATYTAPILTLSGSDTVAHYQQVLRTVTYNNTSQNPSTTARVISFVANDGTANSNTATRSVSIAAVNNAPVVTTTGGATSFTEGGGPVAVDAGVTVSDADNTTLASATVTITNLLNAGAETLAATTTGTSITASYVAPTLTLTGSDTLAHYQQVLQSVTYNNSSQNPSTTTRVIAFVANDGALNSVTANKSVTITAVDQAPVLTAGGGSPTFTEGGAAVTVDPGITVADVDNTNLASATVTITNLLDTGFEALAANTAGTSIVASYTAPTLTLTGSDTLAHYQQVLRTVTYNNTQINPDITDRVIAFVGNDGTLNSNTANTTVKVVRAPHAPVLTSGGGTTTFTEDGGPVPVEPLMTVVDVDSANLASATVTITNLLDTGLETLAANTAGTSITASYVAPTLSLSGSDTVAHYQQVLRSVTYNNASQNPSTTARVVSFVANDGGLNSNTLNRPVTVVAVNDAPVLANPGAVTFTEDGPAVVIASAITASDVDNANLAGGTVTITNLTDTGFEFLAANTAGTSITASYAAPTLTLSGSDTVAHYQQVLRTVTYNHTSQNPTASPTRSVAFIVSDGAANSNTLVSSVTVVPVNDPPVPTTNPIIYTTPGNTQLHVAGATLAGVAHWDDASSIVTKAGPFTDPDGPSAPSIVAASGSSTNGGSFTINTNGSFTYVPPAGFTGTDSFTYQVTDGVTPSTGTINVTVGARVWYIRDVVDANNAAGGDGRSTNAFDTITAFNAATTNDGDIIYIFEGNTGTTPLTTAATLSLRDGQKLWGQGIDLLVPSFGTALVTATNKPRIRTNTASVDVVTVPATAGTRNNVEIRGLDLEAAGATSNAITVNATGGNAVGVTISDDNVRGATGKGINLSAATTGVYTVTVQNDTVTSAGIGVSATTSAAGTVTVTSSGNTITSTGANALDARTAVGAGSLLLAFDSNTVTAGASGIVVDGSLAGTTTITNFSNNAVSGNTVGSGILVTSATFDNVAGGAFNQVSGGSTVIGAAGAGNGVGASGMQLTNVSGDLSFADLDIFADNGAGLFASGTTPYTGSAGFQIAVGAVSTIAATNGPAVSLQTVKMNNLPFQQITSTNSTSTGVALNSVLGTFSAGSGSSITGSTGTGFQVGSSNATISYAGTITTTTGKGVDLTSNTGSTISFTNTLTLSSGSNIAFNATGGGTVTTTDPNSTLTSTTGTALNVASTAIGSGGLIFKSISANGAAKGISLNSTGVAAGNGGLSVTGTGATTGSGGTIQNISARGAEFITTKALSLKNMNFTNANTTDGGTCTDLSTTACNAAIYLNAVATAALDNINVSGTTAQEAINGISVSNFTLNNSTLTNCGTSGTVEEGCIKMRELTGTCSITGSDLSFPGQDVVEIVNTVGPTLTLNVSNSTLRDSQSSASGGNGLQARSQGTASMVVNVTNSSFLRLRATGLQATAINSATNDVDVTTSTFDPGTGTMIGLDLDADNTGNLVFNVQNNTKIYSRNGPAVNVFGDTNATINGRISNNPDVQVKNNVGSNVGSGIRANINKDATAKIEVKNNVVNIGSDDAGIDLSAIGKTTANAGGATSTLDATVTGNNVTIGATSTYGIVILSATNAGDTNALCANVASNAITRNPSSISSFRARVPSANGFFRMQGFSSNAETTWNANGNTPTSSGGSEVSFGGSGTFAACTAALPTNPGPN